MRFYTVVGVSDSRGRRGPYAGPIRVPLVEPLKPPEKSMSLTRTGCATWPPAKIRPQTPSPQPLPSAARAVAAVAPRRPREPRGPLEPVELR